MQVTDLANAFPAETIEAGTVLFERAAPTVTGS